MFIKKVIALALVSIFCSGCFMAPFIQSYKELGVTEEDRIMLYDKAMNDYKHYLLANRINSILGFIKPEKRGDFARQLRADHKNVKIVDLTIDNVNFLEAAKKAETEVVVKYFESPYYIVNDRLELQNWEFSVKTGWMLASKEIVNPKVN